MQTSIALFLHFALLGPAPADATLSTARADAETTYRVLVDTDLGGDPDDIQSLFRLIHYSDILKVEGIVSSPGPGSTPRVEMIREWIQRADVDHLRARGYEQLMPEDALLSLVHEGSDGPGRPTADRTSEGSRRIIARAHAGDGEPLWVLVWGSMTTLAQALHDDPSIAPEIRIYSIGSSNTRADRASRDYVERFMREEYPALWWIENGDHTRLRDTFRGVYRGGDQSGQWGNRAFVEQNIRGHGTTHGGLFKEKCGDAFPWAGGILKEGDSPSMLYLLAPVVGDVGDVDDPTSESWGGRFKQADQQRFPNYYIDRYETGPECQATIARWRKDILRDWKARWDWYGE